MSFVFDINGETVWSPALRVGSAFAGCASALGQAVGVSPGFSFSAEDMIEVDAGQLEAFAHALAQIVKSPAQHRVLADLAGAVYIPCIVMLERAGHGAHGADAEGDLGAAHAQQVQQIGAAMPQ